MVGFEKFNHIVWLQTTISTRVLFSKREMGNPLCNGPSREVSMRDWGLSRSWEQEANRVVVAFAFFD